MSDDASARSRSRGRDFVSTGRGGAGNFVRGDSETRGRVSRQTDGDERGRELSPTTGQQTVIHTGRGGAGNIRSPSRDDGAIKKELEQEREAIAAAQNGPATFSTGRGGAGNILGSRSRSREPTSANRSLSRDPPPGQRYASSGRGGRGNIHSPTPHSQGELEKLDENERIDAGAGVNELHSTGRGGVGNLTSTPDSESRHSTTEAPLEEGVHSTGKGGYGNITHGHGLTEIWNKVTHHDKSNK